MKFSYTAAILAAAAHASETETLQFPPNDYHQECPDYSHMEDLDNAQY